MKAGERLAQAQHVRQRNIAAFEQRRQFRVCSAESGLQGGVNVIVDATFLDAAERELFTSLADRMNVACAFIWCQADPETLLSRVAMRARRDNDASEADQSVVKSQLRNFAPLQSERHRIIQADTRHENVLADVISSVRSLQAEAPSS